MLPIEAIFHSISKTLGSLHSDLPSPEVQIAREEVVGDANGFSEVLTKPEDRANLSNSESRRLKLSKSRSDRHNHENSPEGSTFPKIPNHISSTKRRSDLLDDTRRSTTTNQSNAWYRKAILSLGKISRS